MCHDALRKGRAKELKHMQEHRVSEVLWLGEVGALTKVRSKWLQDVKREAVKAMTVEEQVARGERDDVSAGTPPLAVARTLFAWRQQKHEGSEVHRIVRHHGSFRIVPVPPAGIIQPDQGLFLRYALYGTRKAP